MVGADGHRDEMRARFASTTGGVMTGEIGAITGDLELRTFPATDGTIEAMVRYAGADEWYVVEGSPVRVSAVSPGEHRAAHERILAALTTPGPVVAGNEQASHLRDP